jgi:hypothetical protein
MRQRTVVFAQQLGRKDAEFAQALQYFTGHKESSQSTPFMPVGFHRTQYGAQSGGGSEVG